MAQLWLPQAEPESARQAGSPSAAAVAWSALPTMLWVMRLLPDGTCMWCSQAAAFLLLLPCCVRVFSNACATALPFTLRSAVPCCALLYVCVAEKE